MSYAWKSVTRNFHLTIAVVAAVATLTFFLSVFTNSIQRNQEQLERIYEETTVDNEINGFLVQIDDDKDFYNKIYKMMTDEKNRNLMIENAINYAKQYSFTSVRKELYNVYF